MHQYGNDLADHMREYKSTKWIAVLLLTTVTQLSKLRMASYSITRTQRPVLSFLRVTHFKLLFSLAAWNYEPVFRGAWRKETRSIVHPGTIRRSLVCWWSLGYIPLNNSLKLPLLESSSVPEEIFSFRVLRRRRPLLCMWCHQLYLTNVWIVLFQHSIYFLQCLDIWLKY